MRLPDQLKKNVATVRCLAPKATEEDFGTCFLVSVCVAGNPWDGKIATYIVSVEHVIQANDKATVWPQGSSRGVELLGRWKRPHSTDVAVRLLGEDEWHGRPEPFPADLFATKDMFDDDLFQPGDDIASVGYFPWSTERTALIPALRSGTLAVCPKEAKTLRIGKNAVTQDMLIVELNATIGSSGSPVYGMLEDGDGKLRLLGLVSGEYRKLDREYAEGFAIVTPAWVIQAALDDEELVAKRKKMKEEWLKTQPEIRG